VKAFEDVLKKMKEVDFGFPRLNFAVEPMGREKKRAFHHGPNVQMKRTGTWPVTSLATHVTCAESKKDTKERVRTVAETVVALLITTEGEGGD
jgi:hypothetical protein